jgi:hypothetical protein
MAIDDRDILQAACTVIAGALVLLTISSLFGAKLDVLTKLLLVNLPYWIVIPFSVSAIYAIIGKTAKAKIFMIFGFGVVMAVLVAFVVITYYHGLLNQ